MHKRNQRIAKADAGIIKKEKYVSSLEEVLKTIRKTLVLIIEPS
jgi:hypothetical protein